MHSNTINPSSITKAIQSSIDEAVSKIVKDEAEKAASRVRERVVMEASRIAFMAASKMDGYSMRDKMEIHLRIDHPENAS